MTINPTPSKKANKIKLSMAIRIALLSALVLLPFLLYTALHFQQPIFAIVLFSLILLVMIVIVFLS